jgi:YesN/AraC family two-component response regulator
MKRLLIFFISALWVFSMSAKKIDNPFTQFVGKPYGSYHYALRDSLRLRYNSNNYAYAIRTVKQLRSLPDALHDHQWKLEADFLEANFIHDYRHGSDSLLLKKLNKMIRECRKCGNKIFELRVQRRILDFWGRTNMVQSIACSRQMEQLIVRITPQEYPDVADCMFVLAEMYLNNRDYIRAEKYFNKIVTMPVVNENQRIFILSRNDLGLVMRDYYNRLDLSDQWFKSIITLDRQHPIKELRNQWMAIVQGELGRNMFLRHQFAKAKPMLETSFNTMFREKDYTFSFYIASTLADCCCQMNDYVEAHRFISLADTCRKYSNDFLNLQNYYVAKGKYYAGMHEVAKVSLYIDSVVIAHNQTDLHYNMNPFLQVEQQMGQYELQQKAAESEANFHLFLAILVVSIIFAIICIFYMMMFFQKRNAYRALVLKNQQWAAENRPYLIVSALKKKEEEEAEDKFHACVEDYLEKTQCYRKSDLTLDSLSKELGINRTYLSTAINKMDNNFYSLINKYRVRDAVRLLTDDKDRNIEDLAFAVGYNNRKSFYNAFLSVTGLSPTQFRKNIGEKVTTP